MMSFSQDFETRGYLVSILISPNMQNGKLKSRGQAGGRLCSPKEVSWLEDGVGSIANRAKELSGEEWPTVCEKENCKQQATQDISAL
jgi:hypothetical protein